MKHRDGKPLHDAYLIKKLTSEHPWLPEVYKNLSGYVHFSGQRILSTIHNLDRNSREFEVVISADDLHLPEGSWLEVVHYFSEATKIFLYYLEGWIRTKEGGTR